MSKWQAVVLVPVVFDIEFANDITTAMKGAMAVMKNQRTVDNHIPKLLELRGPREDIAVFAEEQKKQQDLTKKNFVGDGGPLPDDDGPRSA